MPVFWELDIVYDMQPRLMTGAILLGALTSLASANEATVKIACQSLAVYSASAEDAAGSTYQANFTADFTDEGDIVSLNNEWYAASGTIGYETFLYLEDTLFEVGYVAFLEVDIPRSGDSNLNFLTDFLEVENEISAQTSGSVDFGNGPEPVVASWSRAAGQNLGTVTLSLPSPSPIGDQLSFDHTFEIFQYEGKLTYTPATMIGGTVTASVDLTRAGGEGKITGAFPLRVTDSRTLERQPTQWSAPDQVTMEVLGTYEVDGVELFLDRIATRPWYAGSFFFLDGIPGTPFQDEFDLWDMFVNDPNDTDQDGIPDLTDPATVTPTEPPVLSLALTGGSLQITLTGQAGTTVNLERKDSLGGGAWSVVQSVTLANTTETVILNAPAGNSFYRATIP